MSETQEVAGAAEINFQIVPTTQLPPGRSCRLVESAGRLVASVGDAHATPAVCEELSYLHRTLTEQGRWVQTPIGASPDRIEHPAEGRHLASVTWERVAPGVLPKGALAAPVERDGALLWLLREDHVSAQLCAEMSAHGERIVGDGLWQQRWPS